MEWERSFFQVNRAELIGGPAESRIGRALDEGKKADLIVPSTKRGSRGV